MVVPIDLTAVDVLLFDLGNVVIEIDFDRALSHWAAAAGVPLARLRSDFTLDVAYERHERGELDAAGYFAALRDGLGLDLDDASLAAGWNSIYVGRIEPVAAVLPVLARQRRVAAFTNTNALHHGAWGPRFADTLESFEAVYLSYVMGVRKPEPRSWKAVAEALGVAPSRILFFDDTEENVVGARQAGMAAVHVRSPEDTLSAVAPLLG